MGQRILVVDDDAAIRLLVSRMLSRNGFAVDTAEDGHDALEHCRRSAYDLVILDLMMPHKDGIAVIEELIGNGRTPAIIVMTAAVPAIVGRIPDGAVSKTIGKPFEVQELMAAVHDALKGRQ